ncbi:short-chain dehydrogenase [Rhodococcus sp. SC4]|nr:short-chain dehydrogenase [Rhodococcus sp. SC4]
MGKVAIVTGGAAGIGEATAVRLGAAGVTVVVADRNDGLPTVEKIRAEDGDARFVEMDVRSSSDWRDLVAEVSSKYGRVDYLANVAGVVNTISADTVTGLTEEAWDYVVDTNLKGTWLGMKHAIPEMTKVGGGRIVNIASMAALRGIDNLAAYSASKGGVVSLTKQAAVEYGAHSILINAICPGTIDTTIVRGFTREERIERAGVHIIKRLGLPDEVASMVKYLLLEGSFLTGEIYPVDGGWSARGHFDSKQ